MANLDKSVYNLTYHLGTNVLSGDLQVSLRKNFTNDDFAFSSDDVELTFSPTNTTESYTLIDVVFDPTGKTAGVYSYQCQAASFVSTPLDFTVNVTVIAATDPDPEDPTDPEEDPFNPQSYETKYIIDNNDIKLEILQAKGENPITPISVRGTIIHEYADRKDLLQPIVASSLKVDLEASEDFTLIDLYTEEESKYKIRLSRNEQVIFFGILKPDGIWEDFTTSRWVIEMDAMDGLSILKDLSFVKDNGAPYSGDISQFNALKQCLHRIGYDLPINIAADLPIYEGFAGTDTILKSVLMNADRFYQDAEKDQIMDCEAVLKSVLEPYNATVIQMHGEWWIYRTLDVKDTMNFYRYYANTKTDVVWNAALEIGSHIDNYEIFHANANQKKSISPSTQAFRVNYKYGLTKGLNTNPDFIQNPGGSLNIDGWEILTPSSGTIIPYSDGRGIVYNNSADSYYTDIFYLNEEINFTTNNSVVVDVNLYANVIEPNATLSLFFWIKTDNYVYDFNRGWVLNADADLGIASYSSPMDKTGNYNISGQFGQMPENSRIYVKIGVRGNTFPPKGWPHSLIIKNVTIRPSENAYYKGEFHTAQRSTRISSVTKADKTVSVGDSISDIYLGTLYKENGEPTETWTRIGDATGKPILQIMAEDALRIAPRPMLFFEGNIKGYAPYLSRALINNVPGVFQISKYSYDTQSDINNTNFREYSTAEITDFRYEFTYDYGNTTKVVINA